MKRRIDFARHVPDGFGRVDGASAADGNQHIGAQIGDGLDAETDLLQRRIGHDILKHLPGYAGLLQPDGELMDQPAAHHKGIRDEQGVMIRKRRQTIQRVFPEINLCFNIEMLHMCTIL